MTKDHFIKRLEELAKQKVEIQDEVKKCNDAINQLVANFNAVEGAMQEISSWVKKLDEEEMSTQEAA